MSLLHHQDRMPKEKSEAERREFVEKTNPSRKDQLAMIIAALTTIGPFVLLLAALIFGITWLLFG